MSKKLTPKQKHEADLKKRLEKKVTPATAIKHLTYLVPSYFVNKENEALYKAEAADENKLIKKYMEDAELEEFIADGARSVITEVNSAKTDTVGLIAELKETGIDGLVEQVIVEKVNMEMVEKLITTGELSADILVKHKSVTTSTQLRIYQDKGE